MIGFLAIPGSLGAPIDVAEGQFLRLFGEGVILRQADAGQTVVAEIHNTLIKVSFRDHPIPEEVLKSPIEGAWYWPEARSEFDRHRAHIAVVVEDAPADGSSSVPKGEMEEESDETKGPLPIDSGRILDRVQKALLLTRVLEVFGEAHFPVGVYWDGAPLVHSWPSFSESASVMKPDHLPLRIWIDYQRWSNVDETNSLVTRGLESLGQREIEIHGSDQAPGEISAWAYNISHYILERGEVLQDRQAVGISRTEWVRVFIIESRIDAGQWVYNLDLEAEK
ncbi:MAG TPA: DUF4261 domain-containing protein [Planctomycetes bacterium]|nr:DUF4261 domain-containing protein [Planctomycetota bacterium]